MSRELNQHSLIANDLFDRDGTGSGASCVPSVAANEEIANEEIVDAAQGQPKATKVGPTRRANISEDLWEETRRRHLEARQNWRNLLDRFVKPHS